MKSIYLITIMLILGICPFFSCKKKSNDITFERTFSGKYTDVGYAVQQTSDSGYVIAGYTESFGTGTYDVYLIKTDAIGDPLFCKTFGGSNHDHGYSVQLTTDDGYVIAGETWSFGAGNADVYLFKTDGNGNQRWSKTFGDTSEDVGNSVQQTSDGGYIIAGYTKSFGSGGEDVYLIKTDADGNQQWYKTFGGISSDKGYSVQQATDGGYIIAGTTKSFGAGKEDVYLIKTDANSNQTWYKTFGGANDEGGYSVQQTSDGGYIITGYSDSGGVYLIKTNANGDAIWTNTYAGECGNSVQQTSDGGYIIAGSGYNDVIIIKTDTKGKEKWSKREGGFFSTERGYSVQQTLDGGYIITGYYDKGYGTWGGDWFPNLEVYLIKTDDNGDVKEE